MRTTLKLDDDILDAARSLAAQQRKTVGEVISELVRRALRQRPASRSEKGFPVFDVSPDAPPLTSERVREALEDTA